MEENSFLFKWNPVNNEICYISPFIQLVKSANKKMWFLRRLKILGASTDTLVDIYKLFVRQGMEIASPAWSSGLTRGNITQLERVQSQATKVICGWTPLNSEQRFNKLSLQDLKSRRLQLTKKFAIQFSADPRFESLFPLSNGPATRNKNKHSVPQCNTRRYQTSPLVAFIDILNQEAHKK